MSWLTQAQIHGTIRFILTITGALLAKQGASDLMVQNVTGAAPYIEATIGPLMALGSYIWNLRSHSASGIGKHMAQLKADKPGPEGQSQPQV